MAFVPFHSSEGEELLRNYRKHVLLLEAAKQKLVETAKQRNAFLFDQASLLVSAYDGLAKRFFDELYVYRYGSILPGVTDFHLRRLKALADLMRGNMHESLKTQTPYKPFGQTFVEWALRCANWTWYKDESGTTSVACRTPVLPYLSVL